MTLMNRRSVICAAVAAAAAFCTVLGSVFDARTAAAAQTVFAIAAEQSKTADINLAIPQTFHITRPTQQITSTYASYFITGTSNPAQPVYFNGQAVERAGSMGTFGVLVNLNMGTNTFTFSQGDQTRVVTIVRTAEKPVSAISGITQGSMFPAVHGGGKVGENLPVSCIAPAGATVTANFGGRTVQLSQVAAAQAGIPARFKGQLPVEGDYDPDSIQKVGPVTYTMTYNGVTKSYKSSGNVYVAGRNTYIAVRVTSYAGFVYPNTDNLSVFKELVKKGGADFVKSQDNSYFELYSGGYVPVSQVEIIEGTLKVSTQLSALSYKVGAKSETYTFAGNNTPFYDAVLTDTSFTFRLYNSAGTPTISIGESRLFSSMSAVNENKCTTYTFTFKNRGQYWGYNVSYDANGGTVLEFRRKPALSSNAAKPLEGVSVLLDPGHGGSDPGALGLAGLTGPDENRINLAHTYATRDKLTAMGATVYLTRDEDAYVSLDRRLEAIERIRPDLFISLHHNSIGENVDANRVDGVEIYYHNATSQGLANSLMKSVTLGTGRKERFVRQSYYRVTLLPFSPAVLTELGYMSNPAEYEKLTVKSQIDAAASAIANGVKNALG